MDDYDNFNQPIVIDNGTGSIKVGMSGDDRPSGIIPTLIGSAKHTRVVLSAPKCERVFGEEAVEKRGLLKLRSPMKNGVVTNKQEMTMLWEHIYKDVLKYPSKEHPVLITEAANNPISNRQQIAETFFNSFDVPALFFAPQPVLSLYASGRLTGCVLDSGHGLTQVIPICDGFSVNHAISRMDVGGNDVTLYFQHLLRKLSGITYHTSSELITVRKIKEEYCEIKESSNIKKPRYDKEDKKKVQLPDGKVLNLGSARNRAPELLFNPTLIGLEYGGIHDLILESINKSDLDLRSGLYSQILLSGGSTLFKGFGQRLLYELKEKSKNQNAKIKIFAPKERTITTWVGGSMLASLQNFMPMWITRKEWEEDQIRVFYKKGFL